MEDVCNAAHVQKPDDIEDCVEDEDEEERCAEHVVVWSGGLECKSMMWKQYDVTVGHEVEDHVFLTKVTTEVMLVGGSDTKWTIETV
jgi:hypothetical protein